MNTPSTLAGSENERAAVVVTHRVRKDRHGDYEKWLEEIAPLCKLYPGFLDWHIGRPVHGLTETCTVLIRFNTRLNLQHWMESPARSRLIEPLALGVPLVITPLLRAINAPSNVFLTTLAVTGAVVFLMVFVIMPRYTKLLQKWLFR